jgi:hypothetical protein
VGFGGGVVDGIAPDLLWSFNPPRYVHLY